MILSGRIAALAEDSPIAGGIAASAVGGTASELSGGKFANGARTSGFQYLFNEALSGGAEQEQQRDMPNSVGVGFYEAKLGFTSISYRSATIEMGMNNPFNSNLVLSKEFSLDLFGFGYSHKAVSYNLGDSWHRNTDYTPSWNINTETGGIDYESAIGFKAGRIKAMYNFTIKGVINGAQ